MDTLQSIQKMKIVKDSTYPLQTLPHDARPKTTCNILRLERTVIKYVGNWVKQNQNRNGDRKQQNKPGKRIQTKQSGGKRLGGVDPSGVGDRHRLGVRWR
jgi:hypothetical protein